MPAPDRLSELRQALAANPGSPQLLYLLGAELAQQGHYDDAATALTSAIAIDPSLHTARLQLGLLYLTMEQTERSMAVLAKLDELPEDNALRHFKAGLQALASDQLDVCAAALRRGIALNAANAALNKDMARIQARIEELQSTKAEAPPATTATRRDAPAGNRTDFSLYKTIEDT
jgi:tetratricopeptide (TPR) repeat protein